MARRGGLGRGLDALIPSKVSPDTSTGRERDGEHREGVPEPRSTGPLHVPHPQQPSEGGSLRRQPRLEGEEYHFEVPAGASESEEVLKLIDLDRIRPNPRQPRVTFDRDELEELTASVQAVGVLQPIVVRPCDDGYELIMGERRLRAARAAGLERISALVRVTLDEDLLRDALLENIHRSNLNALEEAAAYEALLADFGVTHEELADRLGKSRSAVSNAIRLLRLPLSVQRRVAAGTITAGHARAVASLTDADQQERLADRIVAEGLTVRQSEEEARRISFGERLAAPVARRQPARPVVLEEVSEQLSDHFATRVLVQPGRKKGRIVIEFATLDDLNRICTTMGVASSGEGETP